MKKIRLYKTMALNIDDEVQNIKVYYDTLEFIDGFASFGYMINDNEVMCTVFDKNLNAVVPCRISSVEDLSTYTNVFKNGIGLYQEGDHIYVIDLNNTKFEGTKPINYVNRINAYLPVDSKRVIAVNEEFYLYNVSDNKRLSQDFSYMELKENELIWYLVFGIKKKKKRYLYTTGTMFKNGKLKNNVLIDDIKAWYSDEDLKDVENIRTLSLKNYLDLRKKEKWETLQ